MKRRVWIVVLGLPDGLDRERLAQREVVAG